MVFLALHLLAAAATVAPEVRTFWKLDEGPGIQPTQVQVKAELVRSGEHILVYRERGFRFSTLGEVDEDRQIGEAVDVFDRVIFPLQVKLFGPCPDIDGNGKVILLLTRSNDDSQHFFFADQMSEKEAVRLGFHSNQGEVLYHAFSEQGNRSVWNLAALAGSFNQLLHYARDPDETGWSELLANYAPYLCHLAPDRSLWGDSDPITRSASAGDPFTAAGWSLLFIHYVRERFGDEGLAALMRRPELGFAGLSAVAREQSEPLTTAELLGDFAMACWLDDTQLAGGRFGFTTIAPPRPPPAVRVTASRPTSGQVTCGVGGMVHLLLEGDGERPLPLTLRGDPSVRWIGRAVHLRRRGPDEELELSFDDHGQARLEPPLLPAGDGVVVAAVPEPGEIRGFDRRTVPLLWGLGWVPHVAEDDPHAAFVPLLMKEFPDAGRSAIEGLSATLRRLSGGEIDGEARPIVTRYAWAPEARDVVGVLQEEATRRGLTPRVSAFLRAAPNDIQQEWSNVLIDLPGRDQRRWPVVLAAHWDAARSTLADSYLHALNIEDNASGVAVALETAEALGRMGHRAPILVALLDGGCHDAAGAHALLDQLQGHVAAWIELDAVGRPQRPPRRLSVILEGVAERTPLPRVLEHALKDVGLEAVLTRDIASPHTGASVALSRGIPSIVLRSRDAAETTDELDTPVRVERQELSPELMALISKALAEAAIQLAGAP
jgi:Peptidase family M28